MLTSRERVIATLNHRPVDRAPRDLWISPAVEQQRGDEVSELMFRFPLDIERAETAAPHAARARGVVGDAAGWTDAWGCRWQPSGAPEPPRDMGSGDAAAGAAYRPPRELLDPSRWSGVNPACAATSRFVLAWSDVRPADRIGWLCGTRSAVAELERGRGETRQLLTRIHQHFCAELEAWAATDVDGVVFQDNGPGAVEGLTAGLWREVFRPLYHDYCEILHAADKFVFVRCGGAAVEMIEDLVEAGADAIHAETDFAAGKSLCEALRGRVTFWGWMDAQLLTPTVSTGAIRARVEQVRNALDFGNGGLIAQGRFELETSLAHLAALFDAWARPLPASQRLLSGELRKAI